MTFRRLSSYFSSPLQRQRSLAQVCFWVAGSMGVIGAFIGFAGAVLENPTLTLLGPGLVVPSILCGVIADWVSRALSSQLAIVEPDHAAIERQQHQIWQSGYEVGKLEAFAVIEPDPEAGLLPDQYRLTPEVDNLRAQLEAQQAQMQQAAEYYSRELESRDGVIADLNQQLAYQTHELGAESTPFSHPAQQEANWLKQRLAERDQQIHALNTQLAQLTQAHQEALKDQHSQGYAEGVSQARTQYLLQIEKLATTNIQLQEQLQQQTQPKPLPTAPLQAQKKPALRVRPKSPASQPSASPEPAVPESSSAPTAAVASERSPQPAAAPPEESPKQAQEQPVNPEGDSSSPTPAQSALKASEATEPTLAPSEPANPEITECPHCHTKTRHAIQGRNKKTGKINRWKCKNKDCRKTFKAVN